MPIDGPLGNPRLVFARSDGRAFLSEVWEPGKPAGCRLQSRKDHTQTAERENGKELAETAAERVEVVLTVPAATTMD